LNNEIIGAGMKVSFHGYIKPLSNLVNTAEVEGKTIRECLEAFFALYSNIRGDIFDSQGNITDEYAILLDKEVIRFEDLDRPVMEESEIHIITLLSGG
jgi:hypothetical protein